MFGEVGRDGTEAFEDVGHSDEARKILDQYYVGVGPDVSFLSLPTSLSRRRSPPLAGSRRLRPLPPPT